MTESFTKPIEKEFLRLVQLYVGSEGHAKVHVSRPKDGAFILSLDLTDSPLPNTRKQEAIKAISTKVMGANVGGDDAVIGETTFSIKINDKPASPNFLADAVLNAAVEQAVERARAEETDTAVLHAQLLSPIEAELAKSRIERTLHPRPLTPFERFVSERNDNWANPGGSCGR